MPVEAVVHETLRRALRRRPVSKRECRGVQTQTGRRLCIATPYPT
jgi:hypothetical protein